MAARPSGLPLIPSFFSSHPLTQSWQAAASHLQSECTATLAAQLLEEMFLLWVIIPNLWKEHTRKGVVFTHATEKLSKHMGRVVLNNWVHLVVSMLWVKYWMFAILCYFTPAHIKGNLFSLHTICQICLNIHDMKEKWKEKCCSLFDFTAVSVKLTLHIH